MSFVLMLEILPTGIPSTIYKGLRPPSIELIPLINTEGCEPGASLELIITPATFPCTA